MEIIKTESKILRRIGLFASALLLMSLTLGMSSCSSEEEPNYDDEICQKLTISEIGHPAFGVHPYAKESGFEVVLPAHWKVDSLQFTYDGADGPIINQIKVDSCWTPLQAKLDESMPFEIAQSQLKSITFYQSAMESMFVIPESGSMEGIESSPDHSYGEPGDVVIFNEQGEETFNEYFKDFRGRGNSSWYYTPKRDYNLTFKKKKYIEGLKRDKEFCLIGGIITDALHNYISFEVAKQMQTSYAIEGKLVNLYLNGRYNGVYHLCNRVKIDPDFVNISDIEDTTDQLNLGEVSQFAVITNDAGEEIGKGIGNFQNPEDITGGYLIERLNYKLKYQQDRAAFLDTLDNPCIFKTQKRLTVDEVKYARNELNEMIAAVRAEDGICQSTGKHYSEYVDMESFARYYLVNELLANFDAGIGSLYLAKDRDSIDSRFKLGPVWDMDWTLGNQEGFPMKDIPGALIVAGGTTNQKYGLFGFLAQHDDFLRVADSLYFADLKPILKEWFEKPLEPQIRHDEMLDIQRFYYNIDTLWTDITEFISEKMQTYETFAAHRNDSNYVWINADYGFWRTRALFLAKKGEKFKIPQVPYWKPRDNKFFPHKSLGWTLNGTEIDLDNFVPQENCYIAQKWSEPTGIKYKISEWLYSLGF